MYNSRTMKTIIHEAKIEYLQKREAENKERYKNKKSPPAIWPSDMQSCQRKIALRLLGTEVSVPFSVDSLDRMRRGVVAEDETANALLSKYRPNIVQNFPIKSGVWSGKIDFLLNHKTDNPIIIEHKATGANSFKNQTIPVLSHVAQLCLYGYMYEREYQVKPRLILYYDSWADWSEMELNIRGKRIDVTGLVNGVPETFYLTYDVLDEIQQLEKVYETVLSGGELPPKLIKKESGCTFKGRPACAYYYTCWGENADN